MKQKNTKDRKKKDSPDHLNPSVNSLLNWEPRQATPQGLEFCDYEWKLHCLFLSALLLFCPLILGILALTASLNKKISSSRFALSVANVMFPSLRERNGMPYHLFEGWQPLSSHQNHYGGGGGWGHITNFLLITLLFIFSKYTKAYDQMHPKILFLTS